MEKPVEHFEQFAPEIPVEGKPGAFVNMYVENTGDKIEQLVRVSADKKE